VIGLKPPTRGPQPRHPGGRTYRLMYACALLLCAFTGWRRRQEIGEVWGAAVTWARDNNEGAK
jgi:hypothetical protein